VFVLVVNFPTSILWLGRCGWAVGRVLWWMDEKPNFFGVFGREKTGEILKLFF
jgi:hypothetical protein